MWSPNPVGLNCILDTWSSFVPLIDVDHAVGINGLSRLGIVKNGAPSGAGQEGH